MNTGLYIHIPFCQSKCEYCSFVSMPIEKRLAERYQRALIAEVSAFCQNSPEKLAVDSIYIGGGTPSLLPARCIAEIMETCRESFAVTSTAEVSIEANPGTLEAEKLFTYQRLGVNRISLGAQSFSNAELAAIGRIHDASEIAAACALARDCGIRNLNLDLILGLPEQTDEQWRANLQTAAGLEPSHVSIYMLELDEKSVLYRSLAAGRGRLPDDEHVADWYLDAVDFLNDHGCPQYEISNFARPGCECRHNLKYWQREPVLGFGLAAHSHDGGSRYANTTDLGDYLDAVERGRSPVQWREMLNPIRELEETIFLGLRLNRGLDWEAIRRRHDSKWVVRCESLFDEIAGMGLVDWQGSVVRLTRQGMLISNEILQRFVLLGESDREPARGN
jgi:oxygen-independent coproporphyrinogen III oxidase